MQEPPETYPSRPVKKDDFSNIRIAVVSYSIRHRQYLQRVLEHAGLRVVINEPVSESLLEKLDHFEADVILLDIEEDNEQQLDFIDKLLDKSSAPIIFNDIAVMGLHESSVMGKWFNKLLGKIADVTGKLEWDELELDLESTAISSSISRDLDNQLPAGLATNIWLLGASLGGPDAVKTFLAEIPAGLPVAFVLVQHLGENFSSRLAEQLDKVTSFKVINPQTGHVLRHGEVLIVPVDRRLIINPIGAVELLPLREKTSYSPSIDLVMKDFTERYGKSLHTIIFSGMCDDGVKGAQLVSQQGGEVWVQSPESCIVDSMPSNVMKTTETSFSATPEELAKELIRRYL